MILLIEQLLNGAQFGVMLFLMAAGLTLIFGIMNLINLAHGSLYMIGAYIAAASFTATHSFLLALAAAIVGAIVVGIAIELIVFRALYERDHLDQVLATFGLILFFNEMVRIIWGATALYMQVPPLLSGQVMLLPGVPYPTYRLAIIAVGLLVALLLWLLVSHTRIGMLIRAGASNRTMLGALGVNVTLLYTLVFGLGAGLAALSGAMAGPIFTVEFRHGRRLPDPRVRGHRDRRPRLDPRRVRRRVTGGRGGYRRPRVPETAVRTGDGTHCRRQRWAGSRIDADLCADGGGAVLPADRLVPATRTMISCAACRCWRRACWRLRWCRQLAAWLDASFYVDLFTRIVIFAIAAVSLDLILGYGGMVSFGHAAYLGIGSYAVGILSTYGITNGFVHFGVAIGASARDRAGDRLRVTTHQRRAFHHDHAGVQPDDLLPVREPEPVRRRQRTEHPGSQQLRRSDRSG